MRALIVVMSFFPTVLFAMQQMPVVNPLAGATTLYLTPAFTSTCKRTVVEKKGWFPTKSVSQIAVATSEDISGKPLLTFVTGENGVEVKLVIGVSPSRASLTGMNSFDIRRTGTAVWTNSESLTGKDKEYIDSLKQMVTYMVENSSSMYALGKPLRQGMVVGGDACRLIPSAMTLTSSGGFSVAGTATVNGRNSLVFKGTQSETCAIANQTLSITVNGWYALDLESGLEIAQSNFAEMKLGSTSWTTENQSDCQVSGNATTPAVGTRSVEYRLIEVKSLFDKGLISAEQLEQKRAEILKSLP